MDSKTDHTARTTSRASRMTIWCAAPAASPPMWSSPARPIAVFVRSPHACARIVLGRHRGGAAARPACSRSSPARTWTRPASAMSGATRRSPAAAAQARHAQPAGARARPRHACRRAGRDGDRRDRACRAGRRRARRRSTTTRQQAGDRRARGGPPDGAATVAGGARQYRGRLAGHRRRSRRQRPRGRSRHRVAKHVARVALRQPAPGGRLDGAARRHRELRSRQRPHHAAGLLAERRRACATTSSAS